MDGSCCFWYIQNMWTLAFGSKLLIARSPSWALRLRVSATRSHPFAMLLSRSELFLAIAFVCNFLTLNFTGVNFPTLDRDQFCLMLVYLLLRNCLAGLLPATRFCTAFGASSYWLGWVLVWTVDGLVPVWIGDGLVFVRTIGGSVLVWAVNGSVLISEVNGKVPC